MTVDREQIRRDAAHEGWRTKPMYRQLADTCLALLIELEQAERDVSRWQGRALATDEALKKAERERDEARNKLTLSLEEGTVILNQLKQDQARLAKVPALVEALRYLRGDDVAGMAAHLRSDEVIADALAVWEQE